MHRDPPHLRAGRAGRRHRRSARRQAQGQRRSAIRARRTPAWGRWSRAASRRRRSTASAGWRRKRPSSAAEPSRPRSTASIATSRRSSRRRCCKLNDAGSGAGRARGRGVRAGRDRRALSRRAGGRGADRARRRLAGRIALRRGPAFLARMVERDRPEPWPAAGGRSRDCVSAYRPRHRHAAMQSRRPRPRRQRRGARRPLRRCASITSGSRCRARPICSRACRRARRICIDAA